MSRGLPALYLDYVDPVSWWVFERLFGGTLDPGSDPGSDPAPDVRPFELCLPSEPPLDPDDPGWDGRFGSLSDAPAIGAPGPPSTLTRPTFVPWTRKAHELARHATVLGLGARVHRRLFAAHLTDRLDIGRIDVLVDIAGALGLDRSETQVVLDVDRYAEEIVEARRDAEASGVWTVPTLVTAAGRLEGPAAVTGVDELLGRASM